jgi:hypothetical protein
LRNQLAGGQAELVPTQSVALAEAVQRQIGFQLIMRDPNTGIVVGQRVAGRKNFGTLGRRLLYGLCRINGSQFTRRIQLLVRFRSSAPK